MRQFCKPKTIFMKSRHIDDHTIITLEFYKVGSGIKDYGDFGRMVSWGF